jgi:16S rRNA (cytidine1402-2'-O)-methyltransferase
MRRASSRTSAARTTSGASGTGEAHPNGGIDASKPELAPGLYLVATPIGNLADITLRALDMLRAADRICAEDTRVTHRLLARYGIKKPLEPYHDHNAEAVRPKILAALRRGERVALVSDAGTPLVSDPGYKLVRAAIAEGIAVSAAPGPSAALAALILSGLPPDVFLFAGFLPPRPAARRRALEAYKGLAATLVFFEGPSRLAAALADMAELFGDRPAAVARELTKLHEEVRRGRLAALAAHYRESGPPRGETVIVVGPPEPAVREPADLDARLEAALKGHGVREAASRVAAELGLQRRLVYRRALELVGARE